MKGNMVSAGENRQD